MTAFDFTGSLPQYKALIQSAQLRNRFNDIKTHLLAVNALGLDMPSSVASAAQYDALLLNSGKTGFDFTKVIRSNVAISHDDGNGTVGQVLQSDGDGTTSWVTLSTLTAWTQKTGDFTAATSNRYKCTSGVNTITLPSPTGTTEFYIKPEIGNDLAANNIALSGAMNVAGQSAGTYILDQNAIYYFTSDGTDYDVAAQQIER